MSCLISLERFCPPPFASRMDFNMYSANNIQQVFRGMSWTMAEAVGEVSRHKYRRECIKRDLKEYFDSLIYNNANLRKRHSETN